jgi:hypothetical protein
MVQFMGRRVFPHCLVIAGIVQLADLCGMPHCLLTGGMVQCLVLVLKVPVPSRCCLSGSPANTAADMAIKADVKLASTPHDSCDFFMRSMANQYLPPCFVVIPAWG